jgi:hypothetical protein
METSCSKPVPEILQGLAGEYPLPIVVASARQASRKRAGQQICLSSYQAGPATHGQTHNQQKPLVGWSLRADLRPMAAAIGT